MSVEVGKAVFVSSVFTPLLLVPTISTSPEVEPNPLLKESDKLKKAPSVPDAVLISCE